MRHVVSLFFLPFLLALNGDDDLNKFLGVPSHLDKDEDYESTVKLMDEGMAIAPFPPDNKESRVSATTVAHEEDYSDLLTSSSTESSSLSSQSLHLLDESPNTEASNRQSGANKSLKLVTFAPFKPTFRIPVTTASPFVDGRNPAGYGASGYRPGQALPQYTPAPRTFNYFQHYPFYRLPKAWRLRPDIIYTYPSDRQNAYWQYPHPLLYKDIYGFLRHPNPYGCGPGASYASASDGCGGGGRGQSDSFPERPLGSLNANGKGEWTENDDLNLANKEDPLEDISLETLEKIDKAGKSQDKKDKGHTKHPTLIEDNDLINGHQFMPIGKDEEKFSRVGEESLVGIDSKDEMKEPQEMGKEKEKEKISPEALEELKAFEEEFANLPPRSNKDQS